MAIRKRTPRQATHDDKEPALSVPKMSKRLKFLWALILAGLIISLFSSAYFCYNNLQEQCLGIWESQNIKIALNSPKYLSPGDREEMRVTVINERNDTAAITVTLAYSGTSLCLAGDNEGNTASFGSLPAHGRATSRLEARFPLCLNQLSFQNRFGQKADFTVWLTVDSQPEQLLDTISLHFASIPKTKTLGSLSGALLVGLVALSWKELLEWLKKAEHSTPETQVAAKKGN